MDTGKVAIDRTTHAELVRHLSELVRANYVLPGVANEICTRLQQHLDDGDYDGITEGEFLAYALTHHLQEVNGDEHLWVRWYSEPLPDHEGQLRHNEEWLAQRRLEAELDNYGFRKLERLPGNVGYLEIHKLHRPAWGADTAVAAMNFLASASALILDLRSCTGGYPDMVALILSYLFGQEPVHLNSIYWRDDDLTRQYWTLPHVPGKRFGDKPVYVLIGPQTFSGGEQVAYDLQARRRATLVGERTGGGAHPGASYRLHPHFEAFIPVGRAINPVTGDNWESTGVLPDVEVPETRAFNTAYRLALESIVEQIGDPPSDPLGVLRGQALAALENLK
jgi:hypothetical protein